ncbi:MAG: hypothetical protein GY869_32350, partial [Planctomycetes bacterium]|nr:hypothetical protein [Planctomycetota bacterium]
LFPEHRQQVNNIAVALQKLAEGQIEQFTAEDTQGGDLIYISLHDIRRESYEEYKNALALIPPGVAAYGAIIYRQYHDTSKQTLLYVNNRWVWFPDFISLPIVLK